MNYTKNGFPIWDEEFDREHFTAEEIAESDLRANLISELVRIRKDIGVTQTELESLSGVKQPQIARIEKGDINIKLDTILKLLASLGKTLAIVPLESK